MIRIQNLTKTYALANGRPHIVIDDATVEIPGGRNVAVLGANGAGKSTFLRVISGVEKADSGQIQTQASLSWPLALRGGLLNAMTGRENCRFVLSVHGLQREEINEKLKLIKQLSGLGKYFNEPVSNYSSGMKARLSFALCMTFDYDYFLLDEITSVGDAEFRETCRRWLLAENQPHNIMLVSHDMSLVREFCQIAIVVDAGKLKLYEDIHAATALFSDS